MHRLIDLISLAAWIFIFLSLSDRLPQELGGSAMFIVPVSLMYFYSYIYKKFQKDISIFGIFMLSLVLINYLDHLEKTNETQFVWVLLLFLLLSLIIISSFVILALRALRTSPEGIENSKVPSIKREVCERVILFLLLGLGLFCVHTGFSFLISPDSKLIRNDLIRYVPLATIWLTISLGITLISIKKIEKFIVYSVKKSGRPMLTISRNMVLAGIILTTIIGTSVEISRRSWVLWTDSVFMFSLIVSGLWYMWRLPLGQRPILEIDVEKGPDSLLRNPKNILIIGGVYVISGSIYGIGLAVLIGLTS